MEESNEKTTNPYEDLNDMYSKIKNEIKCQYEKVDKSRQSYFEPILNSIEEKLQSVTQDSNANIKLQAMKASLYYEHAKILIAIQDENDNLYIQLLRDALLLLEDYKLHPEIIYLYFRILNLLTYTLTKVDRVEEARKILEDAEALYKVINNKCNILIYNTDELFQTAELPKGICEGKFEKLISNNLQIQAWIYNKMNLSKKFLRYHHIVLNRQLEAQDGNALAWFYKCARLGVYFFSNNKFVEGKHHLAAAYTILREYELELLKNRALPNFLADWNDLKKYYADLGKYWIKYGLFLFNASRHLTVCQAQSDISINDILITSFQDLSSFGPSREWFNLKKNSMFFSTPNKEQKSPSDVDKQKQAKQSYKNLVGDLTEEKQNDSVTDMAFSPKIEENIVINIEKEIEKMNEEVIDNKAEEINEVTKMLIEALDDRQKEVETNKTDSKEENDTTGIKTEDKNNCAAKTETNEPSKTKTSSESIKADKKESKTSNTSNKSGTSSKTDEDVEYEFKFPSLDLSQFDQVNSGLIDSTRKARDLFFYIQDWVKRAKIFYTIQDYPSEYIQLVLDLNDLYYYLSLYEIELENQYDVQRRRVEILEGLTSLLKEIRPKEYLFLSIDLLQELTQAQIDLLMLNIRRLTNVQSSGNMLLRDICQEHNDVTRKIGALTEIQRRLGSRQSRLSLIDMQLFG